jgi:PAS domain S-box-containing protein
MINASNNFKLLQGRSLKTTLTQFTLAFFSKITLTDTPSGGKSRLLDLGEHRSPGNGPWSMNFLVLLVLLNVQLAVLLLAGPSSALAATTLRFVSDEAYPPLSFYYGTNPKGLGVDLVRAVADQLGRPIDIALLPWSDAQGQLQQGKADFIGPMAITPQRRELYDFTAPFYQFEYVFLIRADGGSVKAIKDLAGKRVGITAGGYPRQRLKSESELTLVLVDDTEQAINLLRERKIDAYAVDKWVAIYELGLLGVHDVVVAGPPFETRESALAVKKGNAELLKELDAAMASLHRSGAYQKLLERWQRSNVVVLSEQEQQDREQRTKVIGALALFVLLLGGVWVLLLKRAVRKAITKLKTEIEHKMLAEAELLASLEDLRQSQRIAHVGSWKLDIASNQVVWSEELYKMYGFDPKLPPPPYTEHQKLFTPESWEQLSAALQNTQNTGIPYDLELRTVRPDGSSGWMWVHGMSVLDDNGETIGLRGMAQDITERKQAEASVKLVKHRQAKMIANIGDVIVIIDQDGINRYKSPNVEKWFGWKPEELVGANAFDNVHPDDLAAAQEFVGKLMQSPNATGTTEWRYRCKNGTYKWIEITLINLLDDPDILGVLGNYQDITESKQIEEVQSYLLQISGGNPGEDFFETLARYLAKTLDMGYVCIDTLHGDGLTARTLAIYHDGKLEVNVEYALKDTPCGDVVGKEICVFPRQVCSLFPHDAALQELQAECYLGTTLWSFDMKPIGLIAVIGRNELISSHFAESVMKLVSIRAAGELERRQAYEEKHLIEQQFQQTQKLESLGVLAGGIAHDFNNILAIIMGNCSLAAMDDENAGKYIPEIEKASERAAALCRQMLAYAGKAPLTQSQVNTWMLVDEMVTMLKTSIQKNVVIKPRLGADIPTITGDASQIRQVVMNLIINAAEAIGDAEGEIDVKLAKAEIKAEQPEKDHLGTIIATGRYICFEVSDNGCGMDDDTRRKIFEPFYTTKFTGRGLGMSAVLGIVKAHNGALQLESQPGQGTTFKIYLPVQPSKTETEEAHQKAVSAAWHGSGTILLAEDEVQVKSIVIAQLQKLGFTVLDAANGKEALELYQQNAADINMVITDMGMPVMNGYELFYKLKQLNPKTPIIISSGFGEGDIASKIPSEAIAGLINKPYSFDQLRDVLKGVVEGAK